MRKTVFVLIIGVFIGLSAVGATVIWDAFKQDGNDFYYYGGPTPEINFSVETFHPVYIFATADREINAANPRACWVVAEGGGWRDPRAVELGAAASWIRGIGVEARERKEEDS